MAETLIERLKAVDSKLTTIQSEKDRLTGRKEQLSTSLKTSFAVDTIEDAKKLRDGFVEEDNTLTTKAETLLQEAEAIVKKADERD
ncbi:MAG: hypothetical protein WC346_06120 [Methanogenium sp.]|jgi:hypothetical protein